jgi:serine/threonine protein kinase
MTAGAPASVQSDIFSMGVVLWEALAARKLFSGLPVEALQQIRRGEIAPLAPIRRDLPAPLVAVVHRALEVDPKKRFRSATEMAEALAAVLRAVPRVTDADLARSVASARVLLATTGTQPVATSTPMSIDLGQLGPKGKKA